VRARISVHSSEQSSFDIVRVGRAVGRVLERAGHHDLARGIVRESWPPNFSSRARRLSSRRHQREPRSRLPDGPAPTTNRVESFTAAPPLLNDRPPRSCRPCSTGVANEPMPTELARRRKIPRHVVSKLVRQLRQLVCRASRTEHPALIAPRARGHAAELTDALHRVDEPRTAVGDAEHVVFRTLANTTRRADDAAKKSISDGIETSTYLVAERGRNLSCDLLGLRVRADSSRVQKM